jgi:hypothetical protein
MMYLGNAGSCGMMLSGGFVRPEDVEVKDMTDQPRL